MSSEYTERERFWIQGVDATFVAKLASMIPEKKKRRHCHYGIPCKKIKCNDVVQNIDSEI